MQMRKVYFKEGGGIIVVPERRNERRKTRLGNRGNKAWKLLTEQDKQFGMERGIRLYGHR